MKIVKCNKCGKIFDIPDNFNGSILCDNYAQWIENKLITALKERQAYKLAEEVLVEMLDKEKNINIEMKEQINRMQETIRRMRRIEANRE